ncbi:unnamed protein product, partial [marine sediment metagenome]
PLEEAPAETEATPVMDEVELEVQLESAEPVLAEVDLELLDDDAEEKLETLPEVAEGEVEQLEEGAAKPSVAAEPTPVADEVEAAPVAAPAEKVEAPAPVPGAGMTEAGRATNDPRFEARPVESVDIETAEFQLFSDEVAPPVEQLKSKATRATNDPRGASGSTGAGV